MPKRNLEESGSPFDEEGLKNLHIRKAKELLGDQSAK
jgi:hypothetical protein